MKQIINNRLAALLEDLDKEESPKPNHEDNNKPVNARDNKGVVKSGKYTDYVKDSEKEKKNTRRYKADVELLDSKISKEDFNGNLEILDDIERIKEEKDKKQKAKQTEELKHLAIHNVILQGIIGHMDLGEVYARVHALIHNLETSEVSKGN